MGRPRRTLGVVYGAFLLALPGVAWAGEPPPVDTSHANRCDFLDQANCLMPFPDDYYTVRADTATGRQVALRTASMGGR